MNNAQEDYFRRWRAHCKEYSQLLHEGRELFGSMKTMFDFIEEPDMFNDFLNRWKEISKQRDKLNIECRKFANEL